MNKLIPATLAMAAVLAFSPAFAEDAAKPADAAAVEATVTTDAAAEATAAKTYVLADGTTNVVVEDGKVFVVAADGTKTPAPDGEDATTTEGVTRKVKDGALDGDAEATPGSGDQFTQ